MRGMPSTIQTRQDLQNLFALWQQGYEGFDKNLFVEKVNALCAQQFFHLPVVKIDGKVVTVRFFNEAAEGVKVEGGATIASFEHFTPPEDLLGDEGEDDTPTLTALTLSKAVPANTKILNVFNDCNYLVDRGFDTAEIEFILNAVKSGGEQ